MVKIDLYQDERYPDYGFFVVDEDHPKAWDREREVSEEDVARFKSAEEAYNKHQKELSDLYRKT